MTYSGMWTRALAAASAAEQAQRAAEQERHRQRRHAQAERAGLAWPTALPPARRSSPSKCPSCGSREWLPHAGKEVCAYCRGDRA
jgi:hypothetical protein